MKNSLNLLFFFLCFVGFSQTNNHIDSYKLNQDFGKIIQDLSDKYIYLKDKKTDFKCVKQNYAKVISKVKTHQQRVLFFEYLLNEFYDNNLVLTSKTKSSFRLHSPFYVAIKDDKFYIQNIWYSQIKDFGKNILGAEILNFNSKEFNKVIDNFPIQCVNKELPEVREWIANKIISGRLNESRILTLKLEDKRKISLDVDKIKVKKEKELLTLEEQDGVAIIRINNSLGNYNLIKHFDKKLNTLLDTKGLVLDLRNTIDAGNSYVVKAIISRFIDRELPYEKKMSTEKFGNNPEIINSSLTFVSPRDLQYEKPVVVLVGRWTGNSGSSLAIGLDGLERAKIVGSIMGDFSGSKEMYSFKNAKDGYSISTNKLFHVSGLIKEKFVSEYNVTQESILNDDVLIKALDLFKVESNDIFMAEIKAKNSISAKVDK